MTTNIASSQEPFETEILSLPVYAGEQVLGYLVLKFSGTIESDVRDQTNPPFAALIRHAAYKAMFSVANKIEIKKPDEREIALLAKAFHDAVDELAGKAAVSQIAVKQIYFLQRNQNRAAN